MIFKISSVSVVISPFSFLILLIWILSLCPLVCLDNYLVDFLKEPALSFVDSLYDSCCFYLVDFSPEFDYFLLSIPLGCIMHSLDIKNWKVNNSNTTMLEHHLFPSYYGNRSSVTNLAGEQLVSTIYFTLCICTRRCKKPQYLVILCIGMHH